MGQIAEAQLICVRCSTLTCRIMLCANCNDSLPIRLEFTPDNRLSRRERTEPGLQPDPSTVKGLILAAESQVGQYEHLITQLQRSADQLKSYISYQKAKISPIRKLPLEMLATVFSLICSSNNAAKVYSGELPALRLSHVSTQWRRLSLSSPSLWSHLHFAHRPRRPRRLRKLLVDPETSRMEVLSIYLTHSRAQALSIYFWMNSSAARARPLARALADHSSRWQDLQICVHDIPLFPSSIRGRLRSLQKLSLLGPGLDLANPYEHFSLCPVLTEVGLKNQRLPNFTLPTSLIRDLSYDSCLPTDLRALETFASSLRTLGLSATYTNHPDEAGIAADCAIEFPLVEKLTMQGQGRLLPFLSAIHTPALKELKILDYKLSPDSTPSEPSPHPEGDIVMSLHHRAFPSVSGTIQTLTISGCSMTLPQLLHTLRSLPTLLHLSLSQLSHRHRTTDNPWDAETKDILCTELFITLADMTVLSTLEHLHLVTNNSKVEPEAIRALVTSRSTLKGLFVHFAQLDFGMIQWLGKVCRERLGSMKITYDAKLGSPRVRTMGRVKSVF